jgi:hypothetical protein
MAVPKDKRPRFRLVDAPDPPGVWKLDRLSRSLKDALHIMERIAGTSAGFRSITENILAASSTAVAIPRSVHSPMDCINRVWNLMFPVLPDEALLGDLRQHRPHACVASGAPAPLVGRRIKKLRELGFRPSVSLSHSIRNMVEWPLR